MITHLVLVERPMNADEGNPDVHKLEDKTDAEARDFARLEKKYSPDVRVFRVVEVMT